MKKRIYTSSRFTLNCKNIERELKIIFEKSLKILAMSRRL